MTKLFSTEGPWRFEFNRDAKAVHLVGGNPRYDLTVVDFNRWGMNSATVRFRRTLAQGLQIMEPASAYAVPVKGREHHASWFKAINHPDARLIEAAPTMVRALIRAAHVMAEVPGRHSPEFVAARVGVVEAIKLAAPEVYGLGTQESLGARPE